MNARVERIATECAMRWANERGALADHIERAIVSAAEPLYRALRTLEDGSGDDVAGIAMAALDAWEGKA